MRNKCGAIKTAVGAVGFLFFIGCRSTGHVDPGEMSRVSLGMTKQEVISSVGPPQTIAAEGRTETLYYLEERPWWRQAKLQVRITDGKVVSFGEAKEVK
jgi:outer membrane protein assembly factor BamE (lipoprotein component of BamABCDE complex)